MSNRTLLERFVRYARMETTSCETSRAVPSTACQMEFQKDLERELRSLGLEGVRLSDSGVLYARMPAPPSARPGSPVIGLLAHVDTSPE
ncbi:hypothetical protein JW921_07665, partial [Candidatus Fermentibacterales bacterium]|nr:hypothetical protein [Candidatus Fermentibacterales bacterium]